MNLASPGHHKISGIEEIAAHGQRFRRVLFSMNDGMHTETINYLPDFGCISFPEKATNGVHLIRTVLVQASATIDPEKLTRMPAGLKETRPSEACKDSITGPLQLQGFTPEQIEGRWLDLTAKSPLDQYDRLWEAGLALISPPFAGGDINKPGNIALVASGERKSGRVPQKIVLNLGRLTNYFELRRAINRSEQPVDGRRFHRLQVRCHHIGGTGEQAACGRSQWRCRPA